MKLKKRTKYMVLTIIAVIVMAALAGIIYELKCDKTQTMEMNRYTYTLSGDVSYTVLLKENPYYEELEQEQGKTYLHELIDKINLHFLETFEGESGAQVSVNYRVFSSVDAYQTNEGEILIIWNKEFPLVEETTEELTGENHFIEEDIELGLKEYEKFVDESKDNLGIALSTRLRVQMEGTYTITLDGETKEEPFVVQCILPLESQLMNLETVPSESKTDQFMETVSYERAVRNWLLILMGSIMAVGILVIIVILWKAKEPDETYLLKKGIDKLMRNYKSRMVEVEKLNSGCALERYRLTSMEGLVKVSDDLQKPILYQKNEVTKVKDYTFYVLEQDKIYSYRLTQK